MSHGGITAVFAGSKACCLKGMMTSSLIATAYGFMLFGDAHLISINNRLNSSEKLQLSQADYRT